jgi:hypothetical protein
MGIGSFYHLAALSKNHVSGRKVKFLVKLNESRSNFLSAVQIDVSKPRAAAQ